MESSTKNRVLALLVALTAAFAAVTVVVLVTTGSFGPVWFAASLLVYGVLAAAGIAVAVLEPGAEAEHPSTPSPDQIELGDPEAIYTTPTGRVLSTDVHAGLDVRRLVFAVTRDDVRPIDDVETRLDGIDLEAEPVDHQALDRELAQRRTRNPHPYVDPDGVPVEILARAPLYRTRSGRLIEAVYRSPTGTRRGLFALVGGQATSIETVERRLDRLPVGSSPDPEAVRTAVEDRGAAPEDPDRPPAIEVTKP